MNMLKKSLALLLTLCMLISVVPLTVFAADTTDGTAAASETGTDFYRILHLDCGRKYFTKDWIIALINEMAAAGYNQLQLAFGNDGLRFLLDDMSVTVDGTTYSSEDVTAGVQLGNKNYYDAGDINELTETEMDEIIAHATSKGIEIVPHYNMPGHMDATLDAIEYVGISDAHFTGYATSVRSLNLNNSVAVSFTKALLQKYVDYFAENGVKFFHIGADEFANDAYYGTMGFAAMGSTLYAKFVTFVEDCAAIVKEANMTPRAWNDGFYYGSYTTKIDTDIQLTYWSCGWGDGYDLEAASSLANNYQLINTNGDYYYILGVNDCYTSGSTTTHVGYDYTAAEGFSNTTFMGSKVSDPVGSMFCVWADLPGAETETEVAKYIRPIMRVIAARMQDSNDYEVDSIVAGGFNADGTINVVEPEEPDVPVTPEEPENVTLTDNSVSVTAPGLESIVVKVNDAVVTEEKVSKTYSITLNDGKYTDAATVKIPYDSAFDGCNKFVGRVGEDEFEVTKDGDFFICEVPHFSDVEIEGYAVEEDTVTSSGGTAASYVLDTNGLDAGSQYLIVYKNSSSSTTGYALNTSKESTNVTISESNVTSSADLSNALWLYSTETSGWDQTTSHMLSNGNLYLYTTRSGSFLNRRYTLNITNTKEYVSLDGNLGIYTISNIGNNSYVSYTNGTWGAQSSKQSLYFYKYTPGTATFTVDASLQESRIAAALIVENDNYTDESWTAYHSALTAAKNKFNTVESTSYSSKDAANTALNELIAAVDALEAAKKNLEKAVTITIKYVVTGNDTPIKTETRTVSEKDTSVTVESFNANNKFYVVETTTLAITPATVKEYTVTVTETEEDLSSVAPLTVEYWITNQKVIIDSATSIEISATSVYSENGTNFDDLVPANDGAIDNPKVLWKGWLLPTGYHQEADDNGGLDMTNNENGNLIQKIRYWNQSWQYTSDAVNWIDIKSSDQIVAYYMQQTNVTEEITTNVVDWGQDYAEWIAGVDNGWFWDGYVENGSKYVFLDFAVVYEDGTQSPASFPTDNTWFFHFDGCSETNPRVLNPFTFSETDEYEIWKITVTDGTSKGYGSASTFTSTYDNETETIVWDESMNGEPFIAALSYTANRSGKLVRIYVRAVETEDSLKVVYYDEKFGNTMVQYNVIVPKGSNFKESIVVANSKTPAKLPAFSGNAARVDATGYGIVNALGKTQNFRTVLTEVPEAVGKYNNALYKYTGSVVSTDGTTITHYYTINQSALSPNLVVDFGLPVEFRLSDVVNKGLDTVEAVDVDEKSKYGELTYTADTTGNNGTFRYTPTSVIQTIDVLTLRITFGGDSSATTTNVGITPATTVYYDDSFINPGTGWISDDDEAVDVDPQHTDVLGYSENNYGYDPAYASVPGASHGSYLTASEVSATTSFEFTGTGIQIFANATKGTGYVAVAIKDTNNNNKIVKYYIVNTSTNGVTVDNMFGLPIISLVDVTDLPHSKYQVELTKVIDGSPIMIDGFRVFGTISDTSIYESDLEDEPVYYELRDYVLNAVDVEKVDNSQYGNISEIAKQIYAGISGDDEAPAAIITDKNIENLYGEGATAQDLLDNGPKNELYLYAGQTLTFNVSTKRTMQIGLKAPAGPTTVEATTKIGDSAATTVDLINNGNDADTISSTVDMFYTLVGTPAGSDTTYTVTIKNTGDKVLSVTLLKICDDPNAAFVPLTVEDIENILTDEPTVETPVEPSVTYADASLTVYVRNMYGRTVGSATLTANGVEGETHTFTAEEILEAVSSAMGKTYKTSRWSLISDVEVVYGESDKTSVQEYRHIIPVIKNWYNTWTQITNRASAW